MENADKEIEIKLHSLQKKIEIYEFSLIIIKDLRRNSNFSSSSSPH